MTEELRQLQDAVRELRDIEEIKRLKARYFECVDTKDWAAWADEVLAEDFQLQSDAGVHEGRDTVVAFISKRLAEGLTVHHGHMPNIMITGPNTASGVWAMADYVRLPVAGGEYVVRGYGRYHEDYVRTDRGWRIQRSALSRLRVDVEAPPPAGDH